MAHDPTQDERLSAYLDGQLTAEARDQFERELAKSEDKRQLVEDLRALSSLLGAMPREALGEDFQQQVMRKAERAMLAATASESDGQSDAALAVDVAENEKSAQETDGVEPADKAVVRKRPAAFTADKPCLPDATSSNHPNRRFLWAALAVAAALLIMVYNGQWLGGPRDLAERDASENKKSTNLGLSTRGEMRALDESGAAKTDETADDHDFDGGSLDALVRRRGDEIASKKSGGAVRAGETPAERFASKGGPSEEFAPLEHALSDRAFGEGVAKSSESVAKSGAVAAKPGGRETLGRGLADARASKEGRERGDALLAKTSPTAPTTANGITPKLALDLEENRPSSMAFRDKANETPAAGADFVVVHVTLTDQAIRNREFKKALTSNSIDCGDDEVDGERLAFSYESGPTRGAEQEFDRSQGGQDDRALARSTESPDLSRGGLGATHQEGQASSEGKPPRDWFYVEASPEQVQAVMRRITTDTKNFKLVAAEPSAAAGSQFGYYGRDNQSNYWMSLSDRENLQAAESAKMGANFADRASRPKSVSDMDLSSAAPGSAATSGAAPGSDARASADKTAAGQPTDNKAKTIGDALVKEKEEEDAKAEKAPPGKDPAAPLAEKRPAIAAQKVRGAKKEIDEIAAAQQQAPTDLKRAEGDTPSPTADARLPSKRIADLPSKPGDTQTDSAQTANQYAEQRQSFALRSGPPSAPKPSRKAGDGLLEGGYGGGGFGVAVRGDESLVELQKELGSSLETLRASTFGKDAPAAMSQAKRVPQEQTQLAEQIVTLNRRANDARVMSERQRHGQIEQSHATQAEQWQMTQDGAAGGKGAGRPTAQSPSPLYTVTSRDGQQAPTAKVPQLQTELRTDKETPDSQESNKGKTVVQKSNEAKRIQASQTPRERQTQAPEEMRQRGRSGTPTSEPGQATRRRWDSEQIRLGARQQTAGAQEAAEMLNRVAAQRQVRVLFLLAPEDPIGGRVADSLPPAPEPLETGQAAEAAPASQADK